jgi:hypothetical protein
MTDSAAQLRKTIDSIESSYEFMLAYAAQGRDSEAEGGAGPSIRASLETLKDALDKIGDHFAAEIAGLETQQTDECRSFAEIVARDAERAARAVGVVLSVGSIGSQLVDNLNATLHVRALLTDMFLLDEALHTIRKAQ